MLGADGFLLASLGRSFLYRLFGGFLGGVLGEIRGRLLSKCGARVPQLIGR
jgi:hypothetical protein